MIVFLFFDFVEPKVASLRVALGESNPIIAIFLQPGRRERSGANLPLREDSERWFVTPK